MKRIISVLISVLLLISTVPASFANFEDTIDMASDGQITFHNGTRFGDSFDCVNGKDPMFSQYENELYNRATGLEMTSGNGSNCLLAGIKNGYVCYFFLKDKLCEIQYYFGASTDYQYFTYSYDTDYQALKKSVTELYGNPLGNSNDKHHDIVCESIAVELDLERDYSGKVIKYDEWVVDCGVYFVKIDLCAIQYYNSDHCYITLGFKPFSDKDTQDIRDAEAAAALAEEQAKIAEEKAIQESINNDLGGYSVDNEATAVPTATPAPTQAQHKGPGWSYVVSPYSKK